MTNQVTVTINDQVITADLVTISQLLNMACDVSATKATKATKAEKTNAKMEAKAKKTAKADKIRSNHDAVLDSKRVERMTDTAQAKLKAAGFETKSSKQGKWVWIYPAGKSSGKGRTPEYKAVKLPKGWSHSMKRGAFYRDFS